MSTAVACDLDETLIDTRVALIESYKHVGANWIPGVPWYQFATPKQHDDKNHIYPMYLREHAVVLPLAEVAVRGDWEILTGASQEAVLQLTQLFPVFENLDMRRVHCNLVSPEDKIHMIKHRGISVYVDDNMEMISRIKQEVPTCQTLHTVR